jgi:hypothetical protein
MEQDNWKIDFYEFDTSRVIKGMAADTNDRIRWIEENVVNNYQALRDSNAELLENLERILDRIKESDLIPCFPSAYKRAKEALNKAKSIK